MAASQRRRQQDFLDSGFLDLNDFGSSRSDFTPIALDSLAGTLAQVAVDFVTLTRDKLEAADRISSGGLADSIIPTEVEIFGQIMSVNILVADFYKFVDEGVKGWADEKGGNSPYQFKNTQPSKKMVAAIRKWVIKEGLKGRGRENIRAVGRRDQKRKSITDTSTKTARTIAASVKKKGIAPSYFWRDTVAEIDGRMREELGKAFKIDIINNLTA